MIEPSEVLADALLIIFSVVGAVTIWKWVFSKAESQRKSDYGDDD